MSGASDRATFDALIAAGTDQGGRLPRLVAALANCDVPALETTAHLLGFHHQATYAECAARAAMPIPAGLGVRPLPLTDSTTN